MKRTVMIILLITVCLALSGTVTAWALSRGNTYTALEVKPADISGRVKESGKIHGKRDKIYYASISAPVMMADVKEGDAVSKGASLLSYDNTDLDRLLKEARIKREQAKLNYEGSVNESNKYASKYNKAKQDDDAYATLYWLFREQNNNITEEQFARQYEIMCRIDSVNKSIADKKRELAESGRDYNEAADYGLTPEEDLSEGDRDDMEDALKEIDDLNIELAELNKELAITSVGNMTPEENSALNDTNNVLEDILRNWSEAKSNKAAYEGNILDEDKKEALKKNTELSAEEEEAAMEELTKAEKGVTSEFAGIVTELNVHDGAFVTEGTPLLTVESSEELVCRVNLSKFDIGEVKKGDRAVIDIAGKEYGGEVTKISSLASTDSSDKSRVEVEVKVSDPDENAIIGIEADVTIFTNEASGTLVIPVEAFYSDDDGDYCYLIENKRIVKQYVTTGIENDDAVEILTGLKQGDIVVTDAVTEDNIGDRANYVIY